LKILQPIDIYKVTNTLQNQSLNITELSKINQNDPGLGIYFSTGSKDAFSQNPNASLLEFTLLDYLGSPYLPSLFKDGTIIKVFF